MLRIALTIRSSGPLRRAAVLSGRGQQRPLNSSVRAQNVKPSYAANLAIVLAVSAWPIIFFACVSMLGDSGMRLSPEANDALHRNLLLRFAFGCGLVFFSLSLAGYSFAAAKVRASLAFLVCVVPFFVFVGLSLT